MKKLILGIILGGIIFSTGVMAGSYNAKQITFTPSDNTWDVSNVESAINDIKLNQSTGGYVALFNSDKGIQNGYYSVPVIYSNDKYVENNSNILKIKKSGKYRIIGSAAHSQNTNTTGTNLYINNKRYIAEHSIVKYNIINVEVDLVEDDEIKVQVYSDGSQGTKQGSTVVVIKE